MRYYKINKGDHLIAIGMIMGGANCGGTEITEAEYNTLSTEINTKVVLVDKLYNKEITISDVPTEWQEEIQRRVNERIEQMGKLEEQPISAEEAVNIILGGEI